MKCIDATEIMILHGDGHSNIEKLDSLENVVDGTCNCIITNIRYSLKAVDYSHLYYNLIAKKNGDAICVLHCLKASKEGGRMAVVVPEGFLFKKELKEVRKFYFQRRI
jgi:type I restriction enzyme M protein